MADDSADSRIGIMCTLGPIGRVGSPLDLAAASQELLYRLLVATIVAWLAHAAPSRFMGRPEAWPQWLGCSPPPTGEAFGGQ